MKLKPYEHWFSRKTNDIDCRSLVEDAFKTGTPDRKKRWLNKYMDRIKRDGMTFLSMKMVVKVKYIYEI